MKVGIIRLSVLINTQVGKKFVLCLLKFHFKRIIIGFISANTKARHATNISTIWVRYLLITQTKLKGPHHREFFNIPLIIVLKCGCACTSASLFGSIKHKLNYLVGVWEISAYIARSAKLNQTYSVASPKLRSIKRPPTYKK